MRRIKNIILKIPKWYLSYIPFFNIPFSSEYRRYLKLLKDSDKLSEEEKMKIQKEKLKNILSKGKEVKYYSSIGLSEDLENYKKIPFLTREIIQKENLLITKKRSKKLLISHTSGSTGVPLTIFRTKDEKAREDANLDFLLEKLGINLKKRVRVLSLRSYIEEGYSLYGDILKISYSLITKEKIGFVINLIENFKPHYIHTHPSTIISFAKILLETDNKVKLENFYGILTSSETFFELQKREVYKAFNCKILDYYGNEENSVSAYQIYPDMEYYYFSKLYSYIEIINREIIATSLNMENMILIRYRTGDLVDNDDINKIRNIVGRTKDYLIDSNDTKIPLENFSTYPYLGVESFQFLQLEKGKVIFKVKIISKNDFNEKEIEKILNKIAPNITFKIEEISDFERSERGKHKILDRRVEIN